MCIQVNIKENTAIIEFTGELDLARGKALREKTDKLKDNIDTVILDLNGVTNINSSGIGQLVSILKYCTLKDQKLRLACLSSDVSQVLSITKLDKVLSIYDSVESAEESVG